MAAGKKKHLREIIFLFWDSLKQEHHSQKPSVSSYRLGDEKKNHFNDLAQVKLLIPVKQTKIGFLY